MPTLADTPPALRQDAAVIGLIGLAHAVSHFSQLLLAPLFPWLKEAFGASYAELGLLLTLFFAVSCTVQAASGFLVDRVGPRPVLFAGLATLGVAALGFAVSQSYAMLAVFAVVAGLGNGVFHPVDYTLLNRKIGKARLGHAYSVHGITGTLGWALAPALMVPLALAFSWRVAFVGAALVAFGVLAVLWWQREALVLAPPQPAARQSTAVNGTATNGTATSAEGAFAFLGIPAVWMCFAFFLCFAAVLSTVQSFAPEAARQLHGVPAQLTAVCLTIYMLCSAGGMVAGGFLAADPQRCERVVATSFGLAAVIALALGFADVPAYAVPVMFGVMGFASGTAGPSRDLIVKRSTPDNASGRVFGVVYSGLDIGQAVAPLVFGHLMDLHQYRSVFLGMAIVQTLLIATAFNVQRARRTVLAPV